MPLPSFLPFEHKDTFFLTDSGVETTFIFKDNIQLRDFAAFELYNDEKGREHLKSYYRRHVDLACVADHPVGFVLESVTWRANPDWMTKFEYGPDGLQDICTKAINLSKDIRSEYPNVPMVISGNIGPRSDGYVPDLVMAAEKAQKYHRAQIAAFHAAGADIVTAATLNYMDEGIGIVKAAREIGIPVILSFTVETNGCLITGESIQTIIETVDKASSGGPAYYMINCAHPTHFVSTLKESSGISWRVRIGGVRANASKLSHAELDEAPTLDEGDPIEFGTDYRELLEHLPNANVFGGCCGTDHRHVLQIRLSCLKHFIGKKKNAQST